MPRSVPATKAHQTLRQLTSTHALDFCSRLLSQDTNGVFTFREFAQTAREMIREHPGDMAVFLAALVAIDMDVQEMDPTEPPTRPPAPTDQTFRATHAPPLVDQFSDRISSFRTN